MRAHENVQAIARGPDDSRDADDLVRRSDRPILDGAAVPPIVIDAVATPQRSESPIGFRILFAETRNATSNPPDMLPAGQAPLLNQSRWVACKDLTFPNYERSCGIRAHHDIPRLHVLLFIE